MEKKPRDMDFEERAREFTQRYDYENDPSVTVAELVRAAGEFLELVVGEKNAAAGMKAMIGTAASEEGTWREDLDQSVFSEWPLGHMLHDLSAYGRYGIDLSADEDDSEEEIEARLGHMVETAEAFLARCPLDLWLGAERPPQLEETIMLARGRWALDHERPIEAQALAILGGVSWGRMRNMLSGKTAVFHAQDGLVPAHEALAWLADRDEFYPSIWRTARPEPSSMPDWLLDEPIAEPLFVPESRDGSVFHPGLSRNGAYTVGPKGSEERHPSFESALEALQRMPAPYWRQPSRGASDAWSLVRGVAWRRYTQAELESLARSDTAMRDAVGSVR